MEWEEPVKVPAGPLWGLVRKNETSDVFERRVRRTVAGAGVGQRTLKRIYIGSTQKSSITFTGFQNSGSRTFPWRSSLAGEVLSLSAVGLGTGSCRVRL